MLYFQISNYEITPYASNSSPRPSLWPPALIFLPSNKADNVSLIPAKEKRERKVNLKLGMSFMFRKRHVCYCFNLLGSQVNGIWQLALEGLGILKQFTDKKSFRIMKFIINHDDRFCFLSLRVIKALSQFTAAGLLINLILESRITKTWDLDTYSPF